MNHPAVVLTTAFVVAVLSLAAWHWRDAWWPGREAAPRVVAPADVPAAPPAASTPDGLAGAPPAVRHPIDAASAPPLPEPAPPTLAGALAGLVGKEALATIVRSDDFARRVVATVDALGREKAPARLWPLEPPAGRFMTPRREAGRAGASAGGGETAAETEVLAAAQMARYARHVALLERTDPGLVVAVYKRFYPQFQQAYEELGYPGRHFNDRVVEVIDTLIATPVPREPVAVRLPVITGPVQPQRPWLLYEFDDPKQQALPAGSQVLLRMGPENQRRVQAWLRQVRRLIAR
ncbi:MAG: DUF3014 domain-containing protein [Burkholderiaceae bacterium]|nr:DUF3014 domain-containing protein [Burkholderiaceae bacterium]